MWLITTGFGLATPLKLNPIAQFDCSCIPDIDSWLKPIAQRFKPMCKAAAIFWAAMMWRGRINVPSWGFEPGLLAVGQGSVRRQRQGAAIRQPKNCLPADGPRRPFHAVRLAITPGVALHSFEDAIMRLRQLLIPGQSKAQRGFLWGKNNKPNLQGIVF